MKVARSNHLLRLLGHLASTSWVAWDAKHNCPVFAINGKPETMEFHEDGAFISVVACIQTVGTWDIRELRCGVSLCLWVDNQLFSWPVEMIGEDLMIFPTFPHLVSYRRCLLIGSAIFVHNEGREHLVLDR